MQYFCLILFLFPWHISYHQESGLINSSWVVCFEFYGIEAKSVVVFTFWSRFSLDDEIRKLLAYLLRNFFCECTLNIVSIVLLLLLLMFFSLFGHWYPLNKLNMVCPS